MDELTIQQKADKYDSIIKTVNQLQEWCSNLGDLQNWQEGDKFFDYDWNQDKSDGYGIALTRIYGELSKLLGKKTILDLSPETIQKYSKNGTFDLDKIPAEEFEKS